MPSGRRSQQQLLQNPRRGCGLRCDDSLNMGIPMKRTKRPSTRTVALAFASYATVLNSSAHAKENAQANAALEEVVVTATKRATSLMDVPSSVSVVDGDLITQLRANDVSDLTRFAPNLSFQDGREAKIKA